MGFWYPSRTQPGLGTLVLNWASPGPSEYAESEAQLDLVTLVPTLASSGHASTAWPAGWPRLDLVTLVPTWASPGHGSSAWPPGWPQLALVWGCHLGLTHTWLHRSPRGPHFDLVNLVLS